MADTDLHKAVLLAEQLKEAYNRHIQGFDLMCTNPSHPGFRSLAKDCPHDECVVKSVLRS